MNHGREVETKGKMSAEVVRKGAEELSDGDK